MNKIDFTTKKYTFTHRFYLLSYLIFFIAATLSFYESIFDLNNAPRIILFALLTSIAVIGALFGFQKVLLGRKFSLRNALFVFILLGSFRGILIYFSLPLTQLPNIVGLEYRMFNSTVTTVFWLTIFLRLEFLNSSFKKRIEGIISQALIKEIRTLSDSELDNALLKISGNLKSLNINSSDNLVNSDIFISAAQSVKKQIDEAIRPLSQRLWLDSRKNATKVNLVNVFRESISQLNYNILLVTFFYFITSLINLSAYFNLLMAFYVTFLGSLIILILNKLFVRLEISKKNSFAINLSFLITISIVSNEIVAFLFPEIIQIWPLYIRIVILFIFPILAIFTSVINLLDRDRTQLARLIEDKISQGSESKNLIYESAQVASYLHNTLQAELLNASRQLELSALDPDSPESRRSLENLGSLINRSISEDFKSSYLNPREKLKELVIGWQGILDIQLDIPAAALKENDRALLLSQIVQEAASNTIKHSDSKFLKIKAKEVPNNQLKIFIGWDSLNSDIDIESLASSWLGSISLITPIFDAESSNKSIIIEI